MWEQQLQSLNVDDNFKLQLEVFLKEVERRYWNFLLSLSGDKARLQYQIYIKIDNGKKYIKVSICKVGNGRTYDDNLHSFIDKSTGDIFKPASYRTPAKTARGNIFINYGFDAFNNKAQNPEMEYHIRYLN